jgi:hypothetical protein
MSAKGKVTNILNNNETKETKANSYMQYAACYQTNQTTINIDNANDNAEKDLIFIANNLNYSNSKSEKTFWAQKI